MWERGAGPPSQCPGAAPLSRWRPWQAEGPGGESGMGGEKGSHGNSSASVLACSFPGGIVGLSVELAGVCWNIPSPPLPSIPSLAPHTATPELRAAP